MSPEAMNLTGMIPRLLAPLIVVLLLAAAGSASGSPVAVQRITVVNDAHVPPGVLGDMERALKAQAWQLRAAWHTPPSRFAPGGETVILRRSPDFTGLYGYHGEDGNGRPFAVVVTGGQLSVAFSHEILEMLVDPHGGRPEVCDAVEVPYRLDGVAVSDFRFPNWSVNGSRGPWDQAHVVTRQGAYAVLQQTTGQRVTGEG
jgi:hypothetical protein